MPITSRVPADDTSSGVGEMESRIRARDWASTPLGPMETWSLSLRMMVRFLLANRFPALLWWGPDYVTLYNDAYIPVLGNKHPKALGQICRECWAEIWDVLRPLIDTPFTGGPATWIEDFALQLNRHGFVEETHFTVAYSPVPDESAPRGIGGVLATVHEITEQVIAERRVNVLRDLGLRVAEGRTAEAACANAAETLSAHPLDVPFALLYLLDQDATHARLAGTAGLGTGEELGPVEVDLGRPDATAWPLAEAVRSESMIVIDDLPQRFAVLPQGPWTDPPQCAVIVPIRSTRVNRLAGLLVAGVSARVRLDDLYRSFFDLVATQIATAIASARSYEEERKRAEALAEIDRAKTVFFSNISHEFRTPLTLMLGPLEELLHDPSRSALSSEQRRSLEVVDRNSRRLLRLVNALLDFSRIEAGRIQARYQPTDLAALTADLASGFRAAIERAGLFLHVDCEPLPQPVCVDRDMWEKIVLNLLSNAFKFTFDGGVSVAVSARGDCAVLSVRDTGVGIPEHEVPRLFDRFHRIEGQKSRSFEGSGIGLALVHELVRLHGGTIEAQSSQDQGTEFTVAIPFGTAHLDQSRIDLSADAIFTTTRVEAFVEEALRWLPDAEGEALPSFGEDLPELVGGRRFSVLVADDNADMRNYVCRLLGQRYDTIAVADGLAALEAIRARRPDLVLSDVMMPRLDGFGLLHAIREDPETRDIPVIILSARAGEEAKVEGLSAGANDYLVKPFSARELLACIDGNLKLVHFRRKATAEVAASERRFRALVSASSDAVYSMNPDWSEMHHLVGRNFIPDTDDPSRSWLEKYIHPDDQPLVLKTIQEAIRTRSMFELEHRVLRVDGSVGWTISRAIPLLDANGEIEEWLGTATDITTRKQAEAALRQLNEQLEARVAEEVAAREQTQDRLAQSQRLQALGQLAGGIAHDFNNVLQAVAGGLNVIDKQADNPEAVRRFARLAGEAAQRGAAITGRLLAFGRRSELQATAVPPGELLESLKEILVSTFGPVVSVQTIVAEDAPPLLADKAQLETVLINLAVNARDAMPEGGRLTISAVPELITHDGQAVPALRPGKYVRIEVKDTGIGMDSATLSRASEPFFTTKVAGQGTGLGLAMARGFAEQSNGGLAIRSAPGAGTTVTLWFPKAEMLADAEAQPRVPEDAINAGMRVLVVDDDAMVREVLASQLMDFGYEVTEAADGLAALSRLDAGETPDLLVTDFAMPGMNGVMLIEEARRRQPELPAILLTGYADAMVDEEFSDGSAGLTVLLRKPISEADLSEGAATLLRRMSGAGLHLH